MSAFVIVSQHPCLPWWALVVIVLLVGLPAELAGVIGGWDCILQTHKMLDHVPAKRNTTPAGSTTYQGSVLSPQHKLRVQWET